MRSSRIFLTMSFVLGLRMEKPLGGLLPQELATAHVCAPIASKSPPRSEATWSTLEEGRRYLDIEDPLSSFM